MKEMERLLTSDFESRMWKEIQRATTKHPDFAKDSYHAVSIITEELGELAQSINDGDKQHAKEELFHVIATCARLYNHYLVLKELEDNTYARINHTNKLH